MGNDQEAHEQAVHATTLDQLALLELTAALRSADGVAMMRTMLAYERCRR